MCLDTGLCACTNPPCVEGSEFEFPTNTKGFSVAGLWTHGKTVYVDSILNNVDYGLRRHHKFQRFLSLYQRTVAGQAKLVSVAAGNGREGSDEGGHKGIPENTPQGDLNVIDSTENLFNYDSRMAPQTLRDVVWLMNTGAASAEVAFDDYLNVDAFIVSPMTASTQWSAPPPYQGVTKPRLTYQDGFNPDDNTGTRGNVALEVHLQNAATPPTTRWDIPAFGKVVGRARIEPVAMGGVSGRGFWLNAKSSVEYACPTDKPGKLPNTTVRSPNNELPQYGFYMGIFVDPRFARGPDDTLTRNLISLDDGSFIRLKGRARLQVGKGNTVMETDFPSGDLARTLPYRAWSHLGFVFTPDKKSVDFYFNGFFYKTLSFGGTPVMALTKGLKVSLGKDGAGFKGWIDDFKVIILRNATEMSPEVLCNEARGSLLAIAGDARFTAIAARYKSNNQDSPGHATIRSQLSNSFAANRFACYVQYNKESGTTRDDIEKVVAASGGRLRHVRERLVFPEKFEGYPTATSKGLRFNEPRPATTNNAFCRSCHSADMAKGLDATALTAGTMPMQQDPRRQPMQPPRIVYGHLPTGVISPPTPDVPGPTAGYYWDRWLSTEYWRQFTIGAGGGAGTGVSAGSALTGRHAGPVGAFVPGRW